MRAGINWENREARHVGRRSEMSLTRIGSLIENLQDVVESLTRLVSSLVELAWVLLRLVGPIALLVWAILRFIGMLR